MTMYITISIPGSVEDNWAVSNTGHQETGEGPDHNDLRRYEVRSGGEFVFHVDHRRSDGRIKLAQRVLGRAQKLTTEEQRELEATVRLSQPDPQRYVDAEIDGAHVAEGFLEDALDEVAAELAAAWRNRHGDGSGEVNDG